jgi:hypothetical protein
MSIKDEVIKAILNLNEATLIDICESLPRYQKDQIKGAIRHAKDAGYIESSLEGSEPLYKLTKKGHAHYGVKSEETAPPSVVASSPALEDGWIEWKGGECPVDGDVVVEVKFRAGGNGSEKALYYRWASWNSHADIIAYRVVMQAPTIEAKPAEPSEKDYGVALHIDLEKGASLEFWQGECRIAFTGEQLQKVVNFMKLLNEHEYC